MSVLLHVSSNQNYNVLRNDIVCLSQDCDIRCGNNCGKIIETEGSDSKIKKDPGFG